MLSCIEYNHLAWDEIRTRNLWYYDYIGRCQLSYNAIAAAMTLDNKLNGEKRRMGVVLGIF